MYNAPPAQERQPKSGNKTLLIILLVIGIPCLLVIILGIVGGFACYNLMKNTVMPLGSCMVAYEEVQKSFEAYAKDHDGRLPKAETWEDDIRPYYAKMDMTHSEKDEFVGLKIEKMPLNGPWGCKVNEKETTGMAFNKDLSGKKLADIQNKDSVVLIFEVPKSGKNLNMPYQPRSSADAPRLFGQPRGWMYIMLSGRNPYSNSNSKIGSKNVPEMPPAQAPEMPK